MKIDWGWFLLFLFLINIFAQSLLWEQPTEDTTKKVSCYDRHSNRIIGLTCKEKRIGIPVVIKIPLSLIILIVSISLLIPLTMKYEYLGLF